MSAPAPARRALDIVARRMRGQSLSVIGWVHRISRQRVAQIIDEWLLPEEKPIVRAAYERSRKRQAGPSRVSITT